MHVCVCVCVTEPAASDAPQVAASDVDASALDMTLLFHKLDALARREEAAVRILSTCTLECYRIFDHIGATRDVLRASARRGIHATLHA